MSDVTRSQLLFVGCIFDYTTLKCWVSAEFEGLLNHVMAALGFPGEKKKDIKQKQMCPNSNLRKQIRFPQVNAAIEKLTCGYPSAFGFQTPTETL